MKNRHDQKIAAIVTRNSCTSDTSARNSLRAKEARLISSVASNAMPSSFTHLPSSSGRTLRCLLANRARRQCVATRVGRLVGAKDQPDERQLQLAVSEEEFKKAADLRDRIAALREELPPPQQFLIYKLQQLEFGQCEEQKEALSSIGQVGGMDILGEVAEYLKNPELDKVAAMTLYHIWHRHPSRDPAIEDLMNQGCKLMMSSRGLPQAEKIFSQIIHLDPAFAEGWNKRATVRFHLGSFQDSIHDCEITIGLNSYHFGAMVGQGFCHMKLHEYRPAVSSFERALRVHPGLVEVREYLGILRRGAEQQEDGS